MIDSVPSTTFQVSASALACANDAVPGVGAKAQPAGWVPDVRVWVVLGAYVAGGVRPRRHRILRWRQPHTLTRRAC